MAFGPSGAVWPGSAKNDHRVGGETSNFVAELNKFAFASRIDN